MPRTNPSTARTPSRTSTVGCAFLCWLAVLCASTLAWADDEGKLRLVVAPFAGRAATIPHAGVIAALEAEPSVDLVDTRQLKEASDVLDGTSEGDIRAAKKLKVRAILRGRVSEIPGGYELVVSIVDGETGKVLERIVHESSTLKEMQKELAASLWSKLSPVFEPPAEEVLDEEAKSFTSDESKPRPKPSAEETEHTDEDLDERDSPECPVIALTAGGGVLLREFGYQNEQTGGLRAFSMRPVPTLGLGATLFPVAFDSCGALSLLAVRLGYQQSIGATARVAGEPLSTLAARGTADVAYPIGLDRYFVTPAVGYDLRVFNVERTLVPDVNYQSVHGGLALGVRLSKVSFEVGGLFKHPFKLGSLRSPIWFPKATAFGYEAHAALGVALAPWFDAHLSAGLEHYRIKLNANPASSPGVADSATDSFSWGLLELVFYLPPRQ